MLSVPSPHRNQSPALVPVHLCWPWKGRCVSGGHGYIREMACCRQGGRSPTLSVLHWLPISLLLLSFFLSSPFSCPFPPSIVQLVFAFSFVVAVTELLNVACSSAMPGGGTNLELALHCLHEAQGNILVSNWCLNDCSGITWLLLGPIQHFFVALGRWCS